MYCNRYDEVSENDHLPMRIFAIMNRKTENISRLIKLNIAAVDPESFLILNSSRARGDVISCIGDVNNDGFDDWAVGLPNAADYETGMTIGKVYIYFGSLSVQKQWLSAKIGIFTHGFLICVSDIKGIIPG